MSKDSFIWLFGRKVKPVLSDDFSCDGCALRDICCIMCGTDGLDPCYTGGNGQQKFVSVD